MRYLILPTLGTCALLSGCLQENISPESRGNVEPLAIAARVNDSADYFDAFHERQSDGGSATEKYADCNINGVLTGFGGQVSSGDFQGITAFCRDISMVNGLGILGSEYSVTNGSPSLEKSVKATPGWVVIGMGGKVDGSDLTRAVIRECEWDQSTRTVKPSTCRYKSTDASNDAEVFYNMWDYQAPQYYSRSIWTGVGMTAGPELVKVVRGCFGYLKGVLHMTNLSDATANHEIRYELKSSDRAIKFIATLSEGLGDADLYVGAGYPPTPSQHDCGSLGTSNTESCSVAKTKGVPMTFHILIKAYQPYSGVTFHAEYYNK